MHHLAAGLPTEPSGMKSSSGAGVTELSSNSRVPHRSRFARLISLSYDQAPRHVFPERSAGAQQTSVGPRDCETAECPRSPLFHTLPFPRAIRCPK